jgi:hypothetical protein
MEPVGSLPHSQEPSTCPYSEPAGSSCTPSHFCKIHLILFPLPPYFPSGLLPTDFPTKTLYATLISPICGPLHLSLLDFITQMILCEDKQSYITIRSMFRPINCPSIVTSSFPLHFTENRPLICSSANETNRFKP